MRKRKIDEKSEIVKKIAIIAEKKYLENKANIMKHKTKKSGKINFRLK